MNDTFWPDEPFDDEEIESDLLFNEADLPEDHRSGFVAVVGRPNAGKSTLMNAYLGQKIAIVSPKPQTTRNRLLGILTRDEAQLIFVDTPGIHKPHNAFGQYLVDEAQRAIPDADVILWLADGSEPPTAEDRLVVKAIKSRQPRPPVILALNKIDLLNFDQVLLRLSAFSELLEADVVMPISAAKGTNRDDLLSQIIAHLPLGPRFYPPDQVTDLQTRFIAAEMIREAALRILQQELPHALAVIVQEFTWRSEALVYIEAQLFVERDSQKGIVIGQKGKTLKKIGQIARPQIEEMVEAKVFLDLRVKVKPKWRKNKAELKRLGYSVE